MRITYLTLDYPPHRFIGAELAAHRLVKWFQGRGHEVDVRITDAQVTRQFQGITARPHGISALKDTDIVITNAGLGTRAAKSYPRHPRVVWAHNNQIGTLLDIKEANAGLTVANTHHMADVLLTTIAVRAGVVLYPPVPLWNAEPEPSPTDGHFMLVNFSRMKGGRLVHELATQLPHREFLLVRGGHGPQIFPMGDLRNVRIVDPSEEMEAEWARCAAVLVPSMLESYSMVGAEAAARGVPVVAHDIPGVREAVGPGGIYIPSLEAADWAVVLQDWPAPLAADTRESLLNYAAGREGVNEAQRLKLEALMEGMVEPHEE